MLWTRTRAAAAASSAAVDGDGNVLVCGAQVGRSRDALAIRFAQ